MLLFHYFPTQSPPKFRRLSCRVTRFFDPLLNEVHVVCYQLSYHTSSHFGSYLLTFRDNLSVPSSRAKQSSKNGGNTELHSYTGNGDVSIQSTWTGTDGPVKETQYYFHEEIADQEIFCLL